MRAIVLKLLSRMDLLLAGARYRRAGWASTGQYADDFAFPGRWRCCIAGGLRAESERASDNIRPNEGLKYQSAAAFVKKRLTLSDGIVYTSTGDVCEERGAHPLFRHVVLN